MTKQAKRTVVQTLGDIAEQALETGGRGMRRNFKSLGACILLGVVVLLALRIFLSIGVWPVIILMWTGIFWALWRVRKRIDLSRLGKALREDGRVPVSPGAGGEAASTSSLREGASAD